VTRCGANRQKRNADFGIVIEGSYQRRFAAFDPGCVKTLRLM
jgi:hypothetical protein